jgi:hypothetical protein
MRRVSLTSEESSFLVAADFLPTALREAVAAKLTQHDGAARMSLVLDAKGAEDLRGALTEQLARVGFDEAYALTSEGEMLECLIDALGAWE